MFGLSTAKLIAGAVAIAAFLSLVGLAYSWKSRMESRGVELTTICVATRAAADNPKMNCKAVPEQVKLLGQAVTDLKKGITDRNVAIAAQKAEDDREKAQAVAARNRAQKRATAAETAASRYLASSRQPVPAGACEPSATVKGTWQ